MDQLESALDDFLHDVSEMLGDTPDEGGYLPISSQVAERIRKLIEAGDVSPGDRLVELDLAKKFGVSRGPVREALFMLARDGIVELTARRGAHVFLPSPKDIEDIYDVRAALFALGARRAAESGDRRFMELMSRGVTLMQQLADAEGAPTGAVMKMRAALGGLVLFAAGNQRLVAEMTRLNMLAITHRRGLESHERRVESAAIWKDVLERIRARDPDGAAAAGTRLVTTGRDELLRRLKEERRAKASRK